MAAASTQIQCLLAIMKITLSKILSAILMRITVPFQVGIAVRLLVDQWADMAR